MTRTRLYVDTALQPGLTLTLPEGAARHVQVLRLQPGDGLTLFNGQGGEWAATVATMGRRDVTVDVGDHSLIDRELPVAVTLAVGMPANERMDSLIEKAAELGAAAIQPLITERSVLRLSGERAERRREHWQGVATGASEQCGRTRVPTIAPIRSLASWLADLGPLGADARWVLAFDPDARPLGALLPAASPLTVLSGPEGGLSPTEVAAARHAGFRAASLGPRVLRADTAPLAVLAHLAIAATHLA